MCERFSGEGLQSRPLQTDTSPEFRPGVLDCPRHAEPPRNLKWNVDGGLVVGVEERSELRGRLEERDWIERL